VVSRAAEIVFRELDYGLEITDRRATRFVTRVSHRRTDHQLLTPYREDEHPGVVLTAEIAPSGDSSWVLIAGRSVCHIGDPTDGVPRPEDAFEFVLAEEFATALLSELRLHDELAAMGIRVRPSDQPASQSDPVPPSSVQVPAAPSDPPSTACSSLSYHDIQTWTEENEWGSGTYIVMYNDSECSLYITSVYLQDCYNIHNECDRTKRLRILIRPRHKKQVLLVRQRSLGRAFSFRYRYTFEPAPQ
jgi:hypothetical protein